MNNKRINFFFIILLFTLMPILTFSQSIDNWTSHISYWADISRIEQAGNKIYSLTDGKLFIYNNEDSSLEEYIKYDGGNTDITHIKYNPAQKCIFITRSDANIELLYENNSYDNISDLKNYTTQNLDKTINSVFIYDNFAYLSTNYGFSIINLEEKEIRESGIFNTKFYSICRYDNKLYAATEKGILVAEESSNIQDFANWKQFPVSNYYTEPDYKFEDKDIQDILVFKDKLHFLFPDSAVYIMDTPESVKGMLKGSKPFDMYITQNDHLIILNKFNFWDFTDINNYSTLNIDWLSYVIPNGNKANEYWVSSTGNNLSHIKTQETSFEYIKRWIRPQGPASNFPFTQNYRNGQLLVSGGGFYGEPMNKPANISIFKDSKWTNIYEYSISSESGTDARDFTYAISDPLDQSHIFASSWGKGLYEFENNSFKTRYDSSNSTIEEIVIGDYRSTRVSGMVYDKDNNLWVLNSMVPNTIKIYTKNKEWKVLEYPELNNPNTNPKNIIIDRFSKKWITSTGEDAYIFILDDNNTPTVNSDDKYKLLSGQSFINDLNQTVSIHYINSIAEDSNGRIWIGTNAGPYWMNNSTGIPSDTKLNRIMVEKDGEANTITPLLDGVEINAIVIDGADRKWIGTQTAGLYLISSEYQKPEELKHFTLNNSPLPSNNIISLSIDSKGTVFIGTDKGLMAYSTGVTKGSDNFSDVYVYPNPVRPDYTGLITVTGLKSGSHVKITDVKGNLIIEGNSLGGQFVWNGQNYRGRRVDTGIYLVFGSSEDGAEGVVTKIMIVNE